MHSWLPWRYLLRRAARSRGFIDPFEFLARLRKFAQPSEVQEPIELIRAGVVFHARGLINTKVLQNNLDWIWPYWVARQFDPGDASFLPRAFSFSHVNLTHRNWSAVGLPGLDTYPIVDPRGMVTPFEDRWSLDWWFIPDDGAPLYPSQSPDGAQRLEFERGLEVATEISHNGALLKSRVWMDMPSADAGSVPVLRMRARVASPGGGRLVLAVRPANPEGISFIDEIKTDEKRRLIVGHTAQPIDLQPTPIQVVFSHYEIGDLPDRFTEASNGVSHVKCSRGLATAGAIFPVIGGQDLVVDASLPLPPRGKALRNITTWAAALEGVPRLDIPQPQWVFLHDAALRTLLLLSPGEIYPGPYTYRRFWFRDACLIMNALIAANLHARASTALAAFPGRQRADGYFHSQEGEWDANGQVLWIADLLERATTTLLPAGMMKSLERGARWIGRKRAKAKGERHTGLLPPGFSAEHLGPNDYYYWDDFWGVAGLKAISAMYLRRGDTAAAALHTAEAEAFLADIQRSLAALPPGVMEAGLPASPYRRMDAGAIGSLVADYPLQLDEVGRRQFWRTADWLWHNCRHEGGFFQDIIHSGLNAYLTLALAQTFLRHGDDRFQGLIESVAQHASPTGHWPEAIHPRTGGGCMGDGQHAWAAAEWVLMMRALFLREENDHLVVGAGVNRAWFEASETFSYGPTSTRWGPVKVIFARRDGRWAVKIDAQWHGQPPRVRLSVPGFEATWAQPTKWETPLVTQV
jgi:hypothetical protein